MRGCIAAILIVLVASISEIKCNMIFQYHIESAGDPYMVAALREALMHSGIQPDGVKLKTILWKNELFKIAYKATYINGNGESCYLKWRVGTFTGYHTAAMPICDNVSNTTAHPTTAHPAGACCPTKKSRHPPKNQCEKKPCTKKVGGGKLGPHPK
ncbi:hypothetical protein GE061_016092 [Apolygus lucorum]|uniref:Secreted protein n=1 Tax=Apolygus lucorum TaxID=248454 RepID=A0A8S9XJ81_APOLU|nr:hypothetical protein GE061_016092 [Apolygus lucorum]